MADFSPASDAYSTISGTSLDNARDSGTTVSMNFIPGPSGPYQYLYVVARSFSAVGFFAVYRGHMFFDLSGADAGTIESATLKLYAYSSDSGGTENNGHKFYVTGHDYGGTLNADLNDINPINKVDGDWTSTSVPTYSSEITVNGVSAGDLISVPLNSTAITEINNQLASGDFDIGLISHYDYKDDFTLTPSIVSGAGYNGVVVASQDHSNSAYRPVLELTYAGIPTPSTVTIKAGSLTISGGTVTIK